MSSAPSSNLRGIIGQKVETAERSAMQCKEEKVLRLDLDLFSFLLFIKYSRDRARRCTQVGKGQRQEGGGRKLLPEPGAQGGGLGLRTKITT